MPLVLRALPGMGVGYTPHFVGRRRELRRLLPDLRYSPLTDQTLCNWLLEQLTAGPRAELQSAYTSDLPEQTAHAAVVFGASAIAVDLPGSAQLDGQTRSRLAAQLASPTSTTTTLATDRAQLDEMIEVAGPVTAWGGLTPEELR